MKTSQESVALICRRVHGRTKYLAQWSDVRQMFLLIGGHVEAGESYRDCCMRAVAEQLDIEAERDFHVAPAPLQARQSYIAESGSAGVVTEHQVELYAVAIHEESAGEGIAGDPANRWLDLAEIRRGETSDGRPISPQVETVLTLFGALPTKANA
ncbi:MAG TPA: NUDIX domain-containing protein [Gemmataceae bacterium]|jgi:ADP-ribose pyrophosphatase YjhB (NUDIX family)|nr:NUDIX domain-containing protein [Gemmataceae bacterium]